MNHANYPALLKMIHPHNREAFNQTIHDSLNKTITKHDIYYRVKTKSNQYKWIVSRGQTIEDQNGHVERIVGTFTEITRSKQMYEELLKGEMRYRSLIEFLPDAIFVYHNGTVLFSNTKAAEMLGWKTIDDVIGKQIYDYIHPDYHEIAKKRLKLLEEGKREILPKFEQRIVRDDGTTIDIEVISASVLYNDLPSIITVARDITDRKETDKKLKGSYRQLEQALEQLKETQAQLIQQEKLAGIGQLAAGIAHEINNPLGFILSNFDTLEKYFMKYKAVLDKYTEIKDKYKENDIQNKEATIQEVEDLYKKNKIAFINQDLEELFQETKEGIDRVAEIVRGLRLFSRVDRLNDFEEYDLNEGIRNTLMIAKNEIKYFAKVEEDLQSIPTIQAMGGAINQVLLNILLNAVYAIKEKNTETLGVISVKTYDQQDCVYCEIEDTGTGIDEKHLRSIFNPFFTTKPEGKGTELGLSIAYDIVVNKHHGDISVKSQKGIGTTFTICLPTRQPKEKMNH